MYPYFQLINIGVSFFSHLRIIWKEFSLNYIFYHCNTVMKIIDTLSILIINIDKCICYTLNYDNIHVHSMTLRFYSIYFIWPFNLWQIALLPWKVRYLKAFCIVNFDLFWRFASLFYRVVLTLSQRVARYCVI